MIELMVSAITYLNEAKKCSPRERKEAGTGPDAWKEVELSAYMAATLLNRIVENSFLVETPTDLLKEAADLWKVARMEQGKPVPDMGWLQR